jgi:hypothetical protein
MKAEIPPKYLKLIEGIITYHDDGTVSVDGDVDFSGLRLTALPVRFRKVTGDFSCDDNRLTSLTGAPTTVGGDFYCDDNKLTSLTGGPTTVGGDFNCHYNGLISLTGAPTTVGGNFYCTNNQLTSLTSGPASVGGDFYCGDNPVPKEELLASWHTTTAVDSVLGESSKIASKLICERLSYRELFRVSEPKRLLRANNVRGPSLDVEAYEGTMYYFFNFKSMDSTTGQRQKGYIRFFKPRNPNNPLDKVECEVDCTCPDYKFRWAWANKQRGSGKVGQGSANKSLNRAPRITNPGSRPGLCKHLLALRNYIFGTISQFPGTTPEDSRRLGRLVKNNPSVSIGPGNVGGAAYRQQRPQNIGGTVHTPTPPPVPVAGNSSVGSPPPAPTRAQESLGSSYYKEKRDMKPLFEEEIQVVDNIVQAEPLAVEDQQGDAALELLQSIKELLAALVDLNSTATEPTVPEDEDEKLELPPVPKDEEENEDEESSDEETGKEEESDELELEKA